jgi:hypothetical protein
MKYLLLLMIFAGCVTSAPIQLPSMAEEMNKSVIDGFFDGDSNKVGNAYLLR